MRPPAVRRQARAQALLEPVNIAGRHGGEDRGDARAQQAGRPDVVEIGEAAPHRNFPRFDLLKTGIRPQAAQRIHARRVGAWRTHGRKTHGAHLGLHRLHGETAARQIPQIGRDRAAGANHPHHLGDAFRRIGHEEKHQRHDRHIEPVFGKRQRHGVALLEMRHARGGTCACEGKLGLRRVNALNFGRRAALDDQFSKGAIAAADVDPPQA